MAEVGGDVEEVAFLQKYYHHLVKCIQPSSFYSWLRSKKVLTEDEQEEIEAKYQIRRLRAGALIDTICRKGKAGYTAFMECVEYLYPDLFQDLTGTEPRLPPKSFEGVPGRSIRRVPTSRARSSEVMIMMANMMQKLTQEVVEKKTKLQELQELLNGVKEEHEIEENEKSSLYVELDITREKNEELKLDNEELHKKLDEMTAERDALQVRCQEMRLKRDESVEQRDQLREKMEKMGYKMEELNGEVRRERSLSTRQDQLEKLKKENAELKKQLDLQMSKIVAETSLLTELTDLRSKVVEFEKKVEALKGENEGLSERFKGLEEMCAMLQENNNEKQNSIRHFTAERDQYLGLYEDSEKQLFRSKRLNEDLSGQCRTYLDRICTLTEKIQDLDNEIAILKDEMPRPSKIPLSESRRLFIGSVESEGNVFTGQTGHTSPPLRSDNDFLRVKDLKRRMGSYETLGLTEPLVVFAPKEIETLLFQKLKTHFDICGYETCLTDSPEASKVTDSPDVIYFKKSATSYSFIQKAQLRRRERNTVLMSMPVHCVRTMKEQLKLNPIVVIIKFKSKDAIPEYTPEEETLNKAPPIKFVPIMVDIALKNNFSSSAADAIIADLKAVVRRENSERGLSSSES